MRRAGGVALICAVGMALGAPNGTAAFKPGGYLGLTSQNKTIIFDVSKKRVKTLGIDIRYTCSDGSSQYEWSVSKHGLKGKIKNGNFKLVQNEFGAKMLVKGNLKGKRASGTARGTYTSGTTSCDTGKLTWTAKRS